MLDTTAEQVLAYIRRVQTRTGRSPTVREIARDCYLPRSTAFYALQRLRSLNAIEIEPHTRRGIRILS